MRQLVRVQAFVHDAWQKRHIPNTNAIVFKYNFACDLYRLGADLGEHLSPRERDRHHSRARKRAS
jgi:hypothetical protein